MTQITHILPRSAWQDIVIYEKNEPLVDLAHIPGLILQPFDLAPSTTTSFMVRKTIAEMLAHVQATLPNGLSLIIIEGYRSMEKQQKAWDAKWLEVAKSHPDWSDEQIDKSVRLVVARATGIPNHVCGGAVDVMLADKQGTLLDFGSTYAKGDDINREQHPMFPNTFFKRKITRKQSANRKMLREAMVTAGFVWYPGEWWHYCYGDRMWAVYTNRKECMYGPVELS